MDFRTAINVLGDMEGLPQATDDIVREFQAYMTAGEDAPHADLVNAIAEIHILFSARERLAAQTLFRIQNRKNGIKPGSENVLNAIGVLTKEDFVNPILMATLVAGWVQTKAEEMGRA